MLKHNFCAKSSADVIYACHEAYAKMPKFHLSEHWNGYYTIATIVLVYLLFVNVATEAIYMVSPHINETFVQQLMAEHTRAVSSSWWVDFGMTNFVMLMLVIGAIIAFGILVAVCYAGPRIQKFCSKHTRRYRVNVRDELIQKRLEK